jgi:hypothetical protein
MKRVACDDWPNVLCPAVDAYPPAADTWETERLLHVALRDAREPQAALELALRSISSQYIQVDWQAEEKRGGVAEPLVEAAAKLKPTLIFAQVQRRNAISGELMRLVREVSDPSVVIVQWDGDQHGEPADASREWYRELAANCDANLQCNTAHPYQYAAMGIPHPGFLEIGIDESHYHPTEPTPGTPPLVMLAARYPHLKGYEMRFEVAAKCEEHYGPAGFGVYGSGWKHSPCGHDLLPQTEEAGVYAAAKAALSISIRSDLARYTSDRLFRMLASGAVSLVERFPECESLGLVNGANCLLWSGWDDLHEHIEDVLHRSTADEYDGMRWAAAALGLEHTWHARMPELMAIVHAVRESR